MTVTVAVRINQVSDNQSLYEGVDISLPTDLSFGVLFRLMALHQDPSAVLLTSGIVNDESGLQIPGTSFPDLKVLPPLQQYIRP